MENDKTWYLNKISYTFFQEGNTLGTTTTEEEIIVDVETQCDSIENEGGFLVIRTNGWSVDSAEELKDMLKLVEDGVSFNGITHIENSPPKKRLLELIDKVL